jgi:hypothetical protein
MRLLLPLALVLAAGCNPPAPAPTDLSALLIFGMQNFDTSDPTNEQSLADAAANFEAWYATALQAEVDEDEEYDTNLGVDRGLIDETARLSETELSGLDPAPQIITGEDAVGVVVVRETHCSLAEVDSLYLRDDQPTLFPDNYIEYARRGQEGYECFQDGSCEEARWITDMKTGILGNTVTTEMSLHNQMRRFNALPLDDEATEPRVGRVSRAWMTEEGVVTPSSVGRFKQNIQFEFIVEQEPSRFLHVYAQWVELQAGEINTEGALFLNSYIDGLRDYMVQLETWCE